MGELLIIMVITILGSFLFYNFYIKGFAVINTKAALFYMGSPRWGKRRNVIEEKFLSCNGSIKRIILLSKAKKYLFEFSSKITKGSVFVEIYEKNKNLIAKLNNEQPCMIISTKKRTNFRVITKFIKADGECKLIWNEV